MTQFERFLIALVMQGHAYQGFHKASQLLEKQWCKYFGPTTIVKKLVYLNQASFASYGLQLLKNQLQLKTDHWPACSAIICFVFAYIVTLCDPNPNPKPNRDFITFHLLKSFAYKYMIFLCSPSGGRPIRFDHVIHVKICSKYPAMRQSWCLLFQMVR